MRNAIEHGAWILAAGALLGPGLASGAETVRPSAAETQLHDQVINTALSNIGKVRAAVEDYHLHHNAFPSNSAEIGLDPSSWASQDVKSVAVGTNGVIEITLAASSGVDNGVIRLTPTMSGNLDENRVDWSCTSPSYSTIADTTNGTCEYSKLP